MGLIKDMKVDTLATEATKALEAGHYFFTPRLNMPGSAHGMTGNIATWGLMIQAVESAGWALAHWAVAMDTKGRTEAYPVFRRR